MSNKANTAKDINVTKSIHNDADLCLLAARGDTAAEEELIQKYSRLVRVCARPYFLAGGDSDDLIQEGMLGLLSAVRHYDSLKNVPFAAFAEYCIRRRILDAVKTAARDKNIPLNSYISLESSRFDEKFSHPTINLRDPEELIIAHERADEITKELSGSLSRFERTILDLYLGGMSYSEMAEVVHKSTKSVDNAVQRIRKKLAQQLKNGGNSES